MKLNVKKIIITSLILNLLLFIIKIVFGLLGNSFSLLGDGINSLIDFVISIILIVTINYSLKEPDKDHNYGHEKIEVIVNLILGMVLVVTSVVLIYSAIISFNKVITPEKYTIYVALASLIIKGFIFYINYYGYKKLKQVSLKAESYNHLGDILATLASLIGIILAIYKVYYFDYIAMIIIALIIFYNGIQVFIESSHYIVDKSPSKEFNKMVKEHVLNIEGVIKIDDYKARIHVNKIYIDIEISVNRNLSLINAHEIAEKVHISVEQQFSDVDHCMVHVNPSKIEKNSWWNHQLFLSFK